MDDRRRQILADMGIETWTLRSRRPSAPSAPAAVPARSGTPVPPGAGEAPDAQAALSELTAALDAESRVAASVADGRRPSGVPATSAAAAAASPAPERHRGSAAASALTVFSLPGAVAVLGSVPARLERRLLQDLLSAAVGRYDALPSEASFDGAVVAGVAADVDGERAAQAFLGRRLETAAAWLLLYDPALAELAAPVLARAELAAIELPPLQELAWSVARKRALWQRIQAARP
jgi:hypothetical protein